MPTLQSKWKPWKDASIEVKTHLFPPTKRWPDWYIRIHEIKNDGAEEVKIQCVQGGFAIQGRGARMGEVLTTIPDTTNLTTTTQDTSSFPEAVMEHTKAALICSNAGASGIRTLNTTTSQDTNTSEPDNKHSGHVLKPDANTNLMWQRTLIPTTRSELVLQKTRYLVSAVFALARTADREERYSAIDIGRLWDDLPVVELMACDGKHAEWCIVME
jgi:hypothetical protein